MGISGIGVQQILPRTGIVGPGAGPAPGRVDDAPRPNAPAAEPPRPEPPPGSGSIVDRLA
jgi:hypothetical protein